MQEDIRKSDQIISRVLRYGSGLSIVFMLSGLVLFVIKKYHQAGAGKTPFLGIHQALAGCLVLDPVALMTTGILILLLTPLLRVVAAFFTFLLVEKDTVYAAVALGVLLILAAGFFVSGFK